MRKKVGKFYISDNPFSIPTKETFITLSSVIVILLCTSMTAWYIIRFKSKINTIIYYLFVLSMVVPFQNVSISHYTC